MKWLSWAQKYEMEVCFPLVFTHWNILHPPQIAEEECFYSKSTDHRPQKAFSKTWFRIKGRNGSEHLLWRPRITLLLIETWLDVMPETHEKGSPLWPSHHNIWKREDLGHFRRGLEERLMHLSSVPHTFIKPIPSTRHAGSQGGIRNITETRRLLASGARTAPEYQALGKFTFTCLMCTLLSL